MSSASAQKAAPLQSVYEATQAALESLTRSWAVALGPRGVRVDAVAPGPSETPGIARFPLPQSALDAARAPIIASLPLRRLASPEEVAQRIVALADPAATWATGQVFDIDGGMAAT